MYFNKSHKRGFKETAAFITGQMPQIMNRSLQICYSGRGFEFLQNVKSMGMVPCWQLSEKVQPIIGSL